MISDQFIDEDEEADLRVITTERNMVEELNGVIKVYNNWLKFFKQ